MKENQLVLLLGGNLGDRKQQLSMAVKHLSALYGSPILKSSIYETAAWGKENQPDFYNQVVVFKCKESAIESLGQLLQIENIMGRVREEKWGSRIMDIDILFYNKEIFTDKNLIIPHPFLHLRKFTLKPLNEIMPDFIHPQLGISVANLLAEIEKIDVLPVNKI